MEWKNDHAGMVAEATAEERGMPIPTSHPTSWPVVRMVPESRRSAKAMRRTGGRSPQARQGAAIKLVSHKPLPKNASAMLQHDS